MTLKRRLLSPAIGMRTLSLALLQRASTHFGQKKIDATGRLSDFVVSNESETRRQDLPPAYAPNEAIYLIRRESLLAARNFFGDQTYAYVMPEERSLDLDTAWDLHLADLILRDATDNE